MHFLKKGRKIWARSDPQPHPTPLFGQYPKENVALLLMSSLKVLNIVNVLNALGPLCLWQCLFMLCNCHVSPHHINQNQNTDQRCI